VTTLCCQEAPQSCKAGMRTAAECVTGVLVRASSFLTPAHETEHQEVLATTLHDQPISVHL
jgi:hypothetical protein